MTARGSASVRGSAVEGPRAVNVECVLCGEPVNVNDRSGAVEREVQGWESLRRKGGANRIGDRTTTGRWRHRLCGEDPQLPGQTSIFDELDA
jgi:hypothetical protein